MSDEDLGRLLRAAEQQNRKLKRVIEEAAVILGSVVADADPKRVYRKAEMAQSLLVRVLGSDTPQSLRCVKALESGVCNQLRRSPIHRRGGSRAHEFEPSPTEGADEP